MVARRVRRETAATTLDRGLGVARAGLHPAVGDGTPLAGASLHGLFPYDWHGAGWRHCCRHAEVARRNAIERHGVDEGTRHVVRCHM